MALLIAAALFSRANAKKSTQCYFLNGMISTDDTPCLEGGVPSHCCNVNDTCMTNGLCENTGTDGFLSRGSCTERDWNTPQCAGNVCPNTNRDGGASIYHCLGADPSAWCCFDDASCSCQDYSTITHVNLPDIQLPLRANEITRQGLKGWQAVPPSLRGSSSGGLSTGGAAGLGVGLGIPLLAALVGIFFLWRANRNLSRQLAQTNQTEDKPESENGEMVISPKVTVNGNSTGGDFGSGAAQERAREEPRVVRVPAWELTADDPARETENREIMEAPAYYRREMPGDVPRTTSTTPYTSSSDRSAEKTMTEYETPHTA